MESWKSIESKDDFPKEEGSYLVCLVNSAGIATREMAYFDTEHLWWGRGGCLDELPDIVIAWCDPGYPEGVYHGMRTLQGKDSDNTN